MCSSDLVRFGSAEDLLPRLEELEGQLTATVHATSQDTEAAARLLDRKSVV